MEKGNFVTWVEPKEAWPPLLIEALKDYKNRYGEGPFQIIDVIQKRDEIRVKFTDKNGKEVILYSKWLEIIIPENPN